MKNKQVIKAVISSDAVKFESEVNELLSDGWAIESTTCGFVNSDKYDFCDHYQAILMRWK